MILFKKKKIVAFVGAVLVVGAMAVAFAGTDSWAAAKKSIYVIDTISVSDGENILYENELSYDSNGMLKENKYVDICTVRFKYEKKHLLKSAVVDISGNARETYKYKNKNGKRVSDTHVTAGGSKIVTKYKYFNSGRLKQVGDRQFKYKNGRIVKALMYGYPGAEWIDLDYDEHGNLTTDPYNADAVIENTYEGGNLVSRTKSYGDRVEVYRYTYKQISVDKKMLNYIKQQQWSLLHDDINAAFNVTVGWG